MPEYSSSKTIKVVESGVRAELSFKTLKTSKATHSTEWGKGNTTYIKQVEDRDWDRDWESERESDWLTKWRKVKNSFVFHVFYFVWQSNTFLLPQLSVMYCND